MLRAPAYLLSLSASLVLPIFGQSSSLADAAPLVADWVFDGNIIHSSGDNRPGISVSGRNSSVLVSNSTVISDGERSDTVYLSGANIDLVVNSSTFATLGNASHGVNFAGAINTSTLSDSTISTQGVSAFALNLQNGAYVQASNLTIDTAGQFASAINVLGSSSIILGDSQLKTSGRSAQGLYLQGSNSSQRALASVEGSTIETRGDSAIGININSNATATLSDTQVITGGANAIGVWVPDADSQLLATHLRVDTQGDGAIGIFTQLGGYAILVGGKVHTEGKLAYALYAGNASEIDARDLSLQVGAGSVGAFAADRSHITLTNVNLGSTETTVGLAAYFGSSITASQSTISLDGGGARALQANNGGTLRLRDVAISANGVDSLGMQSLATAGISNTFELQNSSVNTAVGRAISVQGGGANIDVTDSVINGQTLLAVEQRRMASGALVDSEDVLMTATRSHLSGTITSDALNAQLQLHDKSRLNGDVHGLNSLALDESTWEMTGASQVGRLNLSGGQVRFAGSGFKKLHIDGDLTGNGSFLMRTDLATTQGDLLTVSGQTEGNHTLIVADSGHEPFTPDGQLMLVDGSGGAGQFDLYGKQVDAGAFRYTLAQKDDDWYLVNTSGAPGGSALPRAENLSSGANAAIASQMAAATLWTTQMNALVKRFGDLRMGKDDGGIWARAISNSYNIFGHSSRGFSQNNNGVEIGADTAVAVANGKVHVGAMLGTATSSLNFGEGASGKIDSKMLGAYATYLDDSGIYVDGVLKYARFGNDLKLPTNLRDTVKGSYTNNGYGMDLEVGKHIGFKDGWFIEPQVELSASRTSAVSYTATNGLRVQAQAMDSLQSRVGSLFGRSLELANGMQAQPYFKASYVSRLAGSSHVKVNSNTLKSQLPGDQVEFGFGGALQVTPRSKVSLDAEFAKGWDIEQPWGLTVGYRYLW